VAVSQLSSTTVASWSMLKPRISSCVLTSREAACGRISTRLMTGAASMTSASGAGGGASTFPAGASGLPVAASGLPVAASGFPAGASAGRASAAPLGASAGRASAVVVASVVTAESAPAASIAPASGVDVPLPPQAPIPQSSAAPKPSLSLVMVEPPVGEVRPVPSQLIPTETTRARSWED
jgi:hypothetical protein